jgi:regulatory protein YycI of two-component signal transduction system YycFG
VNWGRAKTILLVAFFLLDVVLGGLYINLRQVPPGRTAPGGPEPELVAQLAERNVALATEVPRETPSLALLRVGIEKLNPYPLALTFFGTLDGVEVTRGADPLLVLAFSRGEEELRFFSSGVTVYTRHGLEQAGGEQTAAQAEEKARAFLAAHGGADGLVLTRVVPYRRDGTYLVEFGQSYGRFPLVGASGAVLVVTPAGVQNYWRRYLTVFGESGRPRKVVSAAEALLALAFERPYAEAAPLTVREIVLGYYSQIYNADEWEAAPVWRIWTGGDTYFYVNAYTGELENLSG